jgi:hypothetical protein
MEIHIYLLISKYISIRRVFAYFSESVFYREPFSFWNVFLLLRLHETVYDDHTYTFINENLLQIFS